MSRIMLHTECFTSTQRVLPITKALQEEGKHEVIHFSTFLATGKKPEVVRELYQSHGVEVVEPETLGMAGLQQEVARAQAEYERGFQQALAAPGLKSNVTYKGFPFLEACQESLLANNKFKIFCMLLCDRVVDAWRPDMILNGYDFGGLKRYFAMAARERGVITVGLQDGAWPWLRSKRVSEFFLVWGEHFRQMHLEEGYRPGSVFAVGQPMLDRFCDSSRDKGAFLSRHGLSPELPTVLVGVTVERIDFVAARLLPALAQRGACQVVLKLHPDFPPSERRAYEELLASHGCPGRVLQHEVNNPLELIGSSDVMLSHLDNFFLEGLALGLELVLWCPEDSHSHDGQGVIKPVQFGAEAYGRPSWTPEEAVGNVLEALDEPGTRSQSEAARLWRRKLYHRLDGRATQRNLEAIERILAGKG